MNWLDLLGYLSGILADFIYSNIYFVKTDVYTKRGNVMKLRCINNTDLLVSPICMGTAIIGSTINERDSFERLDMFYENGGNFLDTSNVYADWIDGVEKSVSEKTIGKWIKARNLTSEIVVATKGGHGELCGQIIGKTRLKREELDEQIQRSMENLCVNSIGLYYLHRDDVSIPVENIMDTLFENIDKGYIKNIGCSNWSLERLKLANEYAKKCNRAGFVVSSDRWSLAKFKPDKDPSIIPFNKERFEYIEKHNMTEIPFQAMGRGSLSLIAEGKKPDENYMVYDNYTLSERAAEIAEKYGTTIAAISIAYLVNQKINVIPIMFFDEEKQIKEAVSGVNIALNDEELLSLTL